MLYAVVHCGRRQQEAILKTRLDMMMEVDQRETLTQLAQSENISVAELLRRIITEGITKRTLAGDQGGKQRRTKINTPWVSATMISVEIADHLLDRSESYRD